MVQKADDYERRMDDKRFEKFDKAIASLDNEKKISKILTIGLIICGLWLVSSLIMDASKQPPAKYDFGLNISYDPQSQLYIIDYTNPNQTALTMNVDIKIPIQTTATTEYTSIYTSEVSTFPANITYKPSNIDYEHLVAVKITKTTGNYTYFFDNTPSMDNNLYNNVYKYINLIPYMK